MALFIFVIVVPVLAVATDLIVNLALVSWAYPWAGWPRSAQNMTLKDIEALVPPYQLAIALGSFLAACVGSLIFAVSHINDACNAMLLKVRRGITFGYLFVFAFSILFCGVLVLTCAIIRAYVGYETTASADVRLVQVPAALQGQVAQNVFNAIDQNRLVILLGSVAFALLIAFWLCNIIAFSDMLPWCNGWKARATVHTRAQQAPRGRF